MYKFIFIIERNRTSLLDTKPDNTMMVSGQSIKWPEDEIYQPDVLAGLKEFFPDSPEVKGLNPLKEKVAHLYNALSTRLRYADNADGIFCINSEYDLTKEDVDSILKNMSKRRLREFLKESKV